MFLIINLIEEPNNAHKHIEGKHTTAAVNVEKRIATIKASSFGKNPDATIIATVQALGLTN